MQKFSDVVLDKNGKAVQGAVVTIVTYPDGVPATIYAADGGPAVKSIKTDENGRFAFYAANGHYSVTVSGTGITPVTYNDVTLFDPREVAKTVLDSASNLLGGGIPARTLGAVLGSTSDQAAILQAGWNQCAAAGVPFIIDGVYWVGLHDYKYPDGLVRKVGLQIPSNAKCVFLPGAAIKTLPNSEPVGYTINAYMADNFELWNPVVYGERAAHIGSAGESGNCFNIVNCTNANIYNPVAYDAWGDGIYVGIEFFSASNKQARNVTITDPKSYNARRNGISVTSGANISIIRPYCEGANGTFPQAGIDLEPEGQGATAPICENWLIDTPVTKQNAGAGINVYTNALAAGSKADIRIINHKDDGSQVGAVTQHGNVPVSGQVQFLRPTWANARANALLAKSVTNGPMVDIVDPVAENCGAGQSSISGIYDSAFCIIRSAGEDAGPTMGNLSIVRARVRDTRSTKKTSCAVYSADQSTKGNDGSFSNAVIDVIEDSSASPWRFSLFKAPDASVRITTAEAAKLDADATRSANYFRRATVPPESVGYRVVNLGRMRQPFSLINLSPTQPVTIYPESDARIYPTGTAAGKGIYSFDPGASLTLHPAGEKDWVAEITSGNWTST